MKVTKFLVMWTQGQVTADAGLAIQKFTTAAGPRNAGMFQKSAVAPKPKFIFHKRIHSRHVKQGQMWKAGQNRLVFHGVCPQRVLQTSLLWKVNFRSDMASASSFIIIENSR